MRFKIHWANLIVLSKFTVFALYYFVFEGNFPSTSPPGGIYLERLIYGGAYFRNFTVILNRCYKPVPCFKYREWGKIFLFCACTEDRHIALLRCEV